MSKKRFVINSLVLFASLALSFVAAEFFLRYTDLQYSFSDEIRFPPNYFVSDPELGADQARNQPPGLFVFPGPAHYIFTNSLGCFDVERKPEQNYVLAIGDSNTWGFTPLPQTWTSVLENQSGRQIVKCGVAGVGTKEELIKARKTINEIGYKPALVLVLYTTEWDLNSDTVFPSYTIVENERVDSLRSLDLRSGKLERFNQEDLTRLYDEWVKPKQRVWWKQFLLDNLMIARLLIKAKQDLLQSSRSSAAGPEDQKAILRHRFDLKLLDVDPAAFPWINQAFEAHLKNLLDLRNFVEAQDSRIVLLTTGQSNSQLGRRLATFIEANFKYHFNVGAYVSNAQEGRKISYTYDAHWNQLGNRLAAEGIYKYLRGEGLF